MHNKLIVLTCAALCSLSVSALQAAELTALLPKSAAGFETDREPRLRTLTSGAERAMLSYFGAPGSQIGCLAPAHQGQRER